MDGFTALGIAANICQFVQYGFVLVKNAKKLRELGSVDPDLERDTYRFECISSSLRSQNVAQDVGGLDSLAAECVEVSQALLSELARLKPKDRKSIRHNLMAVVKSELRKKSIAELERRLEICRTQLNLHLTILSRNELNSKIDNVLQSGQLLKSQLASLNAITASLSEAIDTSYVGQEILSQLQRLVKSYNESLEKSRQETILNLLRFPDMHERFDTVVDAHRTTFRWLLDDKTTTDDANNFEWDSRRIARQDFIDWLENGGGFFHISGKPGAGKSTLMKYICLHPNLENHLKTWCQGSKLGLGRFFFWKPGHSDQKSIKGLLRGLVYSILTKASNLIPVALPQLWNTLLVQSTVSTPLEYRDFADAFANLLDHASNSGQYKFALFIDGLDEFEGRHVELIQTMEAWAQKHPSILKICVSSREYSVFQQSFAPYPKLRLHELTMNDIEKMVHVRLSENPQYLALSDSRGSVHIEQMVTERAEGVFLWVSLVLATIEDGLISGDDIKQLERKVEVCPTELEPLYHHLLNSVHVVDRPWAYKALRLAQFYQENSTAFMMNEPQIGWSGTEEDEVKLSLLQLSFLDDVSSDSSFVNRLQTQVLDSVETTKRLERTQKNVYGRCKGFLEVKESNCPAVPRRMSEHVVFTHRSIIEFLSTTKIVELTRPYMTSFEAFDTACRTLVACFKYLNSGEILFRNPFYAGLGETPSLGGVITVYLKYTLEAYCRMAIRLNKSSSKNLKNFLELTGNVLSEQLEIERIVIQPLPALQYLGLKSLSVGLFEFSDWMEKKKFQLNSDRVARLHLQSFFNEFYRLGKGSEWSYYSQDRLIDVLDRFASFGLDFNSQLTQGRFHADGHFLGSTPWQGFLWDLITDRFPSSWNYAVLVDWFLQHGADTDLTICKLSPNGPHTLPWMFPKEGWEIVRPFSTNETSFSSWLEGHEMPRPDSVALIKDTSWLCVAARESGGVLDMRNCLSAWFPQDAAYFKELLRRVRIDPEEEQSVPEPPIQHALIGKNRDIGGAMLIVDETDVKWELMGVGKTAQEFDQDLALPILSKHGDNYLTLDPLTI